MKTPAEIRKMLRSIRRLRDGDEVNPDYSTAQLITLLWVLDELPSASKKFHDFVAEGKIREAGRVADLMEEHDTDLLLAAINNA